MHVSNSFEITRLTSPAARFTREDHAYDASRLPKKSENDCFAVYESFDSLLRVDGGGVSFHVNWEKGGAA